MAFSGVQVLLTELSPPSSPYCRLLALFITLQQSFAHCSWGISLSATSGVLLGLLLLCQIISIFPALLPSQVPVLLQMQDLALLGEFDPIKLFCCCCLLVWGFCLSFFVLQASPHFFGDAVGFYVSSSTPPAHSRGCCLQL